MPGALCLVHCVSVYLPLVCFFFVLSRVLDRVRVFGVGVLPVELRG